MEEFFTDVCEGKVRAVKSRLEGGCNVNGLDKNGNSALHVATEKGFRGVCKVLLDAGARVNMRNLTDSWTPLHFAAIEGHKDILRMLLAHGANLNLKDKHGSTAEYYADRFHNFETLNVIQEFKPVKSESVSSCSNLSDTDRTLTDEESEEDDESSMMNWVIYGNADLKHQPQSVKRSRSRLKTPTVYEEYSESLRPVPKSRRSDHRINGNMEQPSRGRRSVTPTNKTVNPTNQTNHQNQQVAATNSRPVSNSNKASVTSNGRTTAAQNYEATFTFAPPGSTNRPEGVHADPLHASFVLANANYNNNSGNNSNVHNGHNNSQDVYNNNVHSNHRTNNNGYLDPWNQSSATIPDDLMSLEDVDKESESEKDILLARLQSLVSDESDEKGRRLKGRQKDLKHKEEEMKRQVAELQQIHRKEFLSKTNVCRQEFRDLIKKQQEEEDRIQEEIDKLEAELRNMEASWRLVTSLVQPQPVKEQKYFEDLEDEISCCACRLLLAPPHKIYQCTNGDLFCSGCRDKPVCPACGVYLDQTIRNKALEKIAKKHF